MAAEATNSAYDFCRNSSNMTKDEIKAINSKFLALKKQITEEKKKFVNEHYSSVAGLWVMKELFQKEAISVEDAERLLDKADSKYNDISIYKELKTRIEGTKVCAEGSVLKLQTSNTIDGKSFDIKSLRGKYVIIDFWGTWCGACCAGMPHLKEFRDKYSDKLQVVAVNCGDKKEQWLNSKFTKEYDFVHIKSNKGKNDLSKRFNLSAYPTKILLSPEGKVLKKYVGEYPDLYQEIEDMMKK